MNTIDIIQTVGLVISLLMAGSALYLENVRDRPRLDVIKSGVHFFNSFDKPRIELRFINRSRLANAVEWIQIEQGSYRSKEYRAATVIPPFEIKDVAFKPEWGLRVGLAETIKSDTGISPAAYVVVKTVRSDKPIRVTIEDEYIPGVSEPPKPPLGPGGTTLE